MTRLTRRNILAGSALAALYGVARPLAGAEPSSLPWRNWSGGHIAHPQGRIAPSTEAELMAFLASTTGEVRPVGSGHSRHWCRLTATSS